MKSRPGKPVDPVERPSAPGDVQATEKPDETDNENTDDATTKATPTEPAVTEPAPAGQPDSAATAPSEGE